VNSFIEDSQKKKDLPLEVPTALSYDTYDCTSIGGVHALASQTCCLFSFLKACPLLQQNYNPM